MSTQKKNPKAAKAASPASNVATLPELDTVAVSELSFSSRVGSNAAAWQARAQQIVDLDEGQCLLLKLDSNLTDPKEQTKFRDSVARSLVGAFRLIGSQERPSVRFTSNREALALGIYRGQPRGRKPAGGKGK